MQKQDLNAPPNIKGIQLLSKSSALLVLPATTEALYIPPQGPHPKMVRLTPLCVHTSRGHSIGCIWGYGLCDRLQIA